MKLTIKLPDEDVQALKVKATARGVSAEDYARGEYFPRLAPWAMIFRPYGLSKPAVLSLAKGKPASAS
jgi:hypothetical protein